MKDTKTETMLIEMVKMALTSLKIKHKLSDEDSTTFEFADGVLKLEGTISITEDQALSIFIMDFTDECPSNAELKFFEEHVVKPKVDLCISGEDECNVLLYYFNDIPLSVTTTIEYIQYKLVLALMSVVRIRNLICSEKSPTKYISNGEMEE